MRGSGGDRVGRSSVQVAGHLRWTLVVNPASGNMVGSIGLRPFLIRASGRGPYCLTGLMLVGPICAPTQDEASVAVANHRVMNINVAAQDSRRIEVLAQDLPCFSGAQLAVDITLRSALTSNGEAHPQAADVDGAVLIQARHDKESTYPEIATSGRCKLVVLAVETGG